MLCLHLCAPVVEFLQAYAVSVGSTAHFVQSNHAVEAIERGVLNALRHHGRSELLKALQTFCLNLAAASQREHIANKVEKVWGDICPVCFGNLDGVSDFP